jgi:hypothetical protein
VSLPYHPCWIGREESCEDRQTLFVLGSSICFGRERVLYQCELCHDIVDEAELHGGGRLELEL